MCGEIIRKRPRAIQYVKYKTRELCEIAVKHDGKLIRYVDSPDFDLCISAVSNDLKAIRLIKDKDMREKVQEAIGNLHSPM